MCVGFRLAVLSALTPKPYSGVAGDCCGRPTGAAGARHCIACSDLSDDRDGRSSSRSGGVSNISSGKSNISQLRLEGVPLTPRMLRALAAFGQGLRRLKLYGYDVGADSSATNQPITAIGGGRMHSCESTSKLAPPSLASSTLQTLRDNRSVGPEDRLSYGVATDPKSRLPGGSSADLYISSAPAAPVVPVPVTAQYTAAGERVQDRSHLTRGLSRLLRLLSPHLQELTLQDCKFEDITDRHEGANVGARHRDGMDGAYVIKCVDREKGSFKQAYDGIGCSSVYRGSSIPPAAKPFLDALQSCSALRHLGLRHTSAAGCPVLQLLLLQPGIRGDGGGKPTQIAEGGSKQLDSNRAAASATHLDHSPGLPAAAGTGISSNDVDDRAASDANPISLFPSAGAKSTIAPHGGSSDHVLLQQPQPQPQPQRPLSPEALPPVTLATLTQLASLKIQAPLPAPYGLHTLVAALLQLPGLTRLELGERTAVQAVGSLMLRSSSLTNNATTAATAQPQPLRNLRDLSLVSAHATSTAELATLAELRELTRVSLGAISLGPTPTAASTAVKPAAGLDEARTQLLQRSLMTAVDAVELPLPALLQELSVAAPLAPATLLSLCRPPSLRTLRFTGFSLDMRDVEGLGDSNAAAAAANSTLPLRMRSSSQRELSEALGLLHGRFAYRDLGIELHVGFHGPAAAQRRYLAAADRPMGHWAWASSLVALPLQGLELAGFELLEGDVAALALQLKTLEDLRLDCRYPLPAVAQLSALRRLRRLLLNASFWQQLQAPDAPPALPPHVLAVEQQQEAAQPPQPQLQQGPQQDVDNVQGQGATESWTGHHESTHRSRSDAEVAAAALIALCSAAPKCLYDITLASCGRASARFCAMQSVVCVEAQLAWVGCGSLRLWVSP
ncbi:hypothetical protein Vretimale_11949 [Volvox reticuliferus]|uniref:Uncharacterized protein n=1 Tax=Volvox reticuliferus TaxID=1737510 RepID=A0A8J4GIE1_9CHLO|nr:hypothetical protein Vretimale_11949 [Volvox reticuliferus]